MICRPCWEANIEYQQLRETSCGTGTARLDIPRLSAIVLPPELVAAESRRVAQSTLTLKNSSKRRTMMFQAERGPSCCDHRNWRAFEGNGDHWPGVVHLLAI